MNHAQQRAAERYGLDLSQDDLSAIRLAIGQGRALLLKRHRDGKEEYAVETHGQRLHVVMSPSATIITVLPNRTGPQFLARIDRTYRGNVRRKPEPRRTRGTSMETSDARKREGRR